MTSTLTPSDEKRLKSLNNKRVLYQEKKSLIKNSLANIDVVKAKKIKFDDDDGELTFEYESSMPQSSSAIEHGSSKKIKKRKENSNEKPQLFDDNSDDDGDINFEIKQQFEGETGQRLMKLQSNYKNDKRFILDERFLEDNIENETQVDTNNENKIHFDERNEDNDIETIDTAELDEKQRQMEILNGILGTNHNTYKKYENGDVNKKLASVKTMLRFDPSKPDHSKYISTPIEKEIVKKKKHKKDMVTNNSKTPIVEAPEVSKERFYKIDETITQSLGSEKPFSLLSLFGKNVDDNLNDEEKYESKTLTRTKNTLDEKHTFQYDSSDTEDEKEEKIQIDNESAVLNQPSALVSIEKFFFDKDDLRFKEGLEFFTSRNNTDRDHVEFKKAINKRMHNMKSDRNLSKNKKQVNANQKNMKSNPKLSNGNQKQSNGNHIMHKANRRNSKR